MPSSSTRIRIVEAAVKQAGRSAELYAHSKELLNILLRGCALKNRYPVLRKVGSPMTLLAGTQTVSLPSDFGAATDSMIFGEEKRTIPEFDHDGFVDHGGFQMDNTQGGRPMFFMTDKEAGVWRFGNVADKAYPFIPIYYKLPADLSLDDTDDLQQLWYEDEEAIIEGLIWKIYQYTDDAREFAQGQRWLALDAKYRQGVMPIQAGVSKVRLSQAAFKPVGPYRYRR